MTINPQKKKPKKSGQSFQVLSQKEREEIVVNNRFAYHLENIRWANKRGLTKEEKRNHSLALKELIKKHGIPNDYFEETLKELGIELEELK